MDFLYTHTLAALGIVLFLKSAGVPIPLPGDLLIVGFGVLVSDGTWPAWSSMTVLSLATLGGACVLFVLVHVLGPRYVEHYGHYVGLTDKRLSSVGHQLASGGWWALVVGRTVPGLRLATVVGASLFGIRTLRFVTASGAAAVSEVSICLLIGMALGTAIRPT